MVASFRKSWEQGISDEKRVIAFMKSRGHEVESSSIHDNKYSDIDAWVNGEPMSIKAQHRSVQYGNVGMELMQLLTTHQDDISANQKIQAVCNMPAKEAVADVLSAIDADPAFEAGWFISGKAKHYLILRGTKLHLYKKADIEAVVHLNGFRRIRALTAELRNTQGGSYRYANTISGYLNVNDVPNRVLDIVEDFGVNCGSEKRNK